jgi:hypothetical protein
VEDHEAIVNIRELKNVFSRFFVHHYGWDADMIEAIFAGNTEKISDREFIYRCFPRTKSTFFGELFTKLNTFREYAEHLTFCSRLARVLREARLVHTEDPVFAEDRIVNMSELKEVFRRFLGYYGWHQDMIEAILAGNIKKVLGLEFFEFYFPKARRTALFEDWFPRLNRFIEWKETYQFCWNLAWVFSSARLVHTEDTVKE